MRVDQPSTFQRPAQLYCGAVQLGDPPLGTSCRASIGHKPPPTPFHSVVNIWCAQMPPKKRGKNSGAVREQIANTQAVVTAAQRRLETALRAERAGFGHLFLCEYSDDPGTGGLGTISGFLATQALVQLHDESRLQEPGRCPLDEMSEIVAAAQGFVEALQALCGTQKTLRTAETRTNQSIAAGPYPPFQHTQPIPH